MGKVNHIAIAVPDLEKATSLYRDVLGARVSDKQVHDSTNVSAAMFWPLGLAVSIQNQHSGSLSLVG